MASYRGIFRSVDSVFYRLKKKEKIDPEELEDAGEGPIPEVTSCSEVLNVAAVQEFQVVENEGIATQTSTRVASVSMKIGGNPTDSNVKLVCEEDCTPTVLKQCSDDVIQMDEISNTDAKAVFKDVKHRNIWGQSKLKHKKITRAIKLSPSRVVKDEQIGEKTIASYDLQALNTDKKTLVLGTFESPLGKESIVKPTLSESKVLVEKSRNQSRISITGPDLDVKGQREGSELDAIAGLVNKIERHEVEDNVMYPDSAIRKEANSQGNMSDNVIQYQKGPRQEDELDLGSPTRSTEQSKDSELDNETSHHYNEQKYQGSLDKEALSSHIKTIRDTSESDNDVHYLKYQKQGGDLDNETLSHIEDEPVIKGNNVRYPIAKGRGDEGELDDNALRHYKEDTLNSNSGATTIPAKSPIHEIKVFAEKNGETASDQARMSFTHSNMDVKGQSKGGESDVTEQKHEFSLVNETNRKTSESANDDVQYYKYQNQGGDLDNETTSHIEDEQTTQENESQRSNVQYYPFTKAPRHEGELEVSAVEQRRHSDSITISHEEEQRKSVDIDQANTEYNEQRRQSDTIAMSHKEEQRKSVDIGQANTEYNEQRRQSDTIAMSHKEEQRKSVDIGQANTEYNEQRRQSDTIAMSHKEEQRKSVDIGQANTEYNEQRRQSDTIAMSHKEEQRKSVDIGIPTPIHDNDYEKANKIGKPVGSKSETGHSHNVTAQRQGDGSNSHPASFFDSQSHEQGGKFDNSHHHTGELRQVDDPLGSNVILRKGSNVQDKDKSMPAQDGSESEDEAVTFLGGESSVKKKNPLKSGTFEKEFEMDDKSDPKPSSSNKNRSPPLQAISTTISTEDGIEKMSDDVMTDRNTSHIDTMDGNDSGISDGLEGRSEENESISRHSSMGEVKMSSRKSSIESFSSFSKKSVLGNEKQKESNMEKVVLCDMEPKFFLNKVKFYPIFAVANVFAIIIQYVFNALSSTGPDGTIFLNKTGDLSDKYYTAITPAGWTFSIWGFIYTWQCLWVVFSLVNICRKDTQGQPAYKDPPYIPNTVFILQIVIAALNITWLITFDREEIEVACTALIAYTLMQYLLLTISVRYIEQASPKLVQQQRTMDIWLHRGFLQNGVGIQLAWVNIATLLNVQMVLIYSGDEVLCADDAGTLALAILAVHLLVLPIIDLVLLDRYTRYLFTPYIVVVVALAGSISKNWDSSKTNSIFSAVLISYASALLGFKIIITIYRHFKRPRYTTKCPCKQNTDFDSNNEKGFEH